MFHIDDDELASIEWRKGFEAGKKAALAAQQDGAEVARLRKGIQDYLDGNYDNARKLRAKHGSQARCSHGQLYYEDCGECIDRHFSLLLGETIHPATLEQGVRR